ncbi:TROVE domain-containing protein [Nonomuraea solani]|uniref:TROVE domain-containing protein n=1 Tax=Nonomuraea solani TaxID=1144553 RepID=A0A1H5ZUJ0_9ACTN|nr:TROVE domain-containing protein [Nonomuraea solani]SEG40168.1 TROVE domain-containing protein [Nonomuraea solani]
MVRARNAAGGDVFAKDLWTRLEDFLILGPRAGGLTRQNAGARIHPMEVFLALRVYGSGRARGQRWRPLPAVKDALEEAYERSFGHVEPTGRRRCRSRGPRARGCTPTASSS